MATGADALAVHIRVRLMPIRAHITADTVRHIACANAGPGMRTSRPRVDARTFAPIATWTGRERTAGRTSTRSRREVAIVVAVPIRNTSFPQIGACAIAATQPVRTTMRKTVPKQANLIARCAETTSFNIILSTLVHVAGTSMKVIGNWAIRGIADMMMTTNTNGKNRVFAIADAVGTVTIRVRAVRAKMNAEHAPIAGTSAAKIKAAAVKAAEVIVMTNRGIPTAFYNERTWQP